MQLLKKTKGENSEKRENAGYKYFIELNKRNLGFDFKKQGFEIDYKPDENGNCQFLEFAHRLQKGN